MMYLNYLTQIISEFFPISSTLFLKSLNLIDNGVFHIFSGLLLIIIFYKQIWDLIRHPSKNLKIFINYFFITIPSVIIGLMINYSYINLDVSYEFQVVTNILMGIILYLSVKYFENIYRNPNLKEITLLDSVLLGIFLSLNGLFPGMSRLGTSLIFLLLKGFPLNKAYNLSLFTSIPIIIGKPLMLLIKNPDERFYFFDFCRNYYILILLSFIGGIFIYKLINSYLSTSNLKTFSLLRVIFFVFILISIIV